jgi:hypothetical protein
MRAALGLFDTFSAEVALGAGEGKLGAGFARKSSWAKEGGCSAFGAVESSIAVSRPVCAVRAERTCRARLTTRARENGMREREKNTERKHTPDGLRKR